jgi:hypothetical protein
MFFPANLEGLQLGSYNAPVLRDVRQLAPFPERSNPPVGGLGDDTGRCLRPPQDFVCIQHIGFDNTYDRTSRTLQTRYPITLRQQQPIQANNGYGEAPCRSVPLGTNPPAVIQLQIDGTGNGERSGLDVHSDDEKQLKHKGVVMTRNAGPGDPQDDGGRATSPRSGDEEDIRTTTLGSWILAKNWNFSKILTFLENLHMNYLKEF